MLQLVSLFAIGVLDYTEVGLGVAVVPASAFLALLSARIEVWSARVGPRRFMARSLCSWVWGLLWLGRIPRTSTGGCRATT